MGFFFFFVEGGESNEVDGKWAFVRSLLRVGRGEGYYTNKSRCCFSLRPYRHFVQYFNVYANRESQGTWNFLSKL